MKRRRDPLEDPRGGSIRSSDFAEEALGIDKFGRATLKGRAKSRIVDHNAPSSYGSMVILASRSPRNMLQQPTELSKL